MLDGKMVSDIDANGTVIRDREMSLEDYQVNMLKVQQLLKDTFGLKALAKAGASLTRVDHGGLTALEHAKGEAVRAMG